MRQSSPYRTSVYRDPCDICRAPGDGGCARCARPLCAAHAPPGDHRCHGCEREYLGRELDAARFDVHAMWLPIAGMIAGLAAAAALSLPALALIGAAYLLASVGFAAPCYLPRRGLRPRFLAERAPRFMLLTSGSTDPSID
jgi:hypothetical protein